MVLPFLYRFDRGSELTYTGSCEEKTDNLTFQTISEEEKRNNKTSYNWKDIVVSIIVLAIVAGVMLFFNGN